MQWNRRAAIGALGALASAELLGPRVGHARIFQELSALPEWDPEFVEEWSRLTDRIKGAQIGDPISPDDDPDPTQPLATLDTKTRPYSDERPLVSHAWDTTMYQRLAAGSDAQVVIQNDFWCQAPGWTTIGLYDQELGIFVSKRAGVNALPVEQLRKIVEGRVTSWEVSGCGNQIRLCRFQPTVRGQNAYRSAVDARFAISLSKIRLDGHGMAPRFESLRSYEELADFVRTNPGAIAFGLRGTSLEGLVRVRVQSGRPTSASSLVYPRYQVNLSVRNTRNASSIAAELLREVNGRLALDQRELQSIA